MTAEYLKEEGLEVTSSKTAAVAFTRRSMGKYSLTITGQKILFVSEHSHLGATRDRGRMWTPHIEPTQGEASGVRTVNLFC